MTYRVYVLKQAHVKEVRIALSSLQEQFGSEYTRQRAFKAALAEALEKVREVFPALDYELERSHLVLRESRGRKAFPTREERPALAGDRARELANSISTRAEAWFHVNHPDLDIKTATRDFDNWREQKKIPSADRDARFKSFVKSWAKSA